MSNFFMTVLKLLAEVASNPIAFVVCLIATLAAYAYVTPLIARHQELSKKLSLLPEAERIIALKLEFGEPIDVAGLSAEQWLRARYHKYYLYAYMATLGAIIVIVMIIGRVNDEEEGDKTDTSVVERQGAVTVPAATNNVTNVKMEGNGNTASNVGNVTNVNNTTNLNQNITIIRPPEPIKPEGSISVDITGDNSRHPNNQSENENLEKDHTELSGSSRTSNNLNQYKYRGKREIYSVDYGYKRAGRKLQVSYELGLYAAQANGEYIGGTSFSSGPFLWNYPVLSVKVVNNTQDSVMISEIVFKITKRTLDLRPVLATESPSYLGNIVLRNEGWGIVNDSELDMTILREDCVSYPVRTIKKLEKFSGSISVPIAEIIPPGLSQLLLSCSDQVYEACLGDSCIPEIFGECITFDKSTNSCKAIKSEIPEDKVRQLIKERFDRTKISYTVNDLHFKQKCSPLPACIVGSLTYTDDSGRNNLYRFRTYVYLGTPGEQLPEPFSHPFDINLPSGTTNSEIRKPLTQSIKSGEAVSFPLRIATDRSATFEAIVTINEVSGKSLWTGDIELSIFVPRSGAALGL